MYACILETGRGFFERVCTPSNATANFRDPPPPSLKRRLVLPYSKFSGQVFARHTITVAIEVVRIARVLLQHLLCFFMGHEACAVHVANSPLPGLETTTPASASLSSSATLRRWRGWVPRVVHGVSRPRSYFTRKP